VILHLHPALHQPIGYLVLVEGVPKFWVKMRGIGVDMPNPERRPDRYVHRRLLPNDVLILDPTGTLLSGSSIPSSSSQQVLAR
jgi:kynurenine formamidase